MEAVSVLNLNPEDEVNYAFLKTIQNKFQTTDFMCEYEEALYQKMLRRFNDRVKDFDPAQLISPIKTYKKEDINPDFFKKIICQSVVEPFIVKGFLNDAAAMKQWSFDFFQKEYADAIVAYGMRYDDGKIEDGLMGKMNEVFDLMRTAKGKVVYINNTAQIFKDYPALLKDINHEHLKQYYHPIAVNMILQLFMGGPKTGVGLHCANEFNSFLMIQGKKRWTFISSEYSYALRAKISINALNAVTEIDDHTRDFDYYEKHFPLYNRVPKLIADIEPGDMLVFSPWWWHAVDNITDTSIAVATRWTAIKHNKFPRGNIIYQNIQRSNPLFQAYSKMFMNAVVSGELIDDTLLAREYFGKTTKE